MNFFLQKAKQLTEEQIAEIKVSFDHFDQDSNGFITTRELRSVIEAIGTKITEPEIKKMVC